MAKTLKSAQKIACVGALATATNSFLADLQTKSNALKSATETIKLQKFDKFHNNLINATVVANDIAEQLSDTLMRLCSDWSSRPGIAPTAVTEFEAARTTAASIKSSIFTVAPVELSDDLHENLTDETQGGFAKALKDFCGSKDAYIQAVAAGINEYMTEDTQEVFTNIGAGIEQFCNTLIDVFESNKKAMNEFAINLDELQATVAKSSAVVTDAGSSASKKIAAEEEGLN